MENFKPIPGYSNYEIGDRGTVVSLNYNRTGQRKNLQPRPASGTDKNHLSVALCKNGKLCSFLIHRLVAEAFLGPCPPGMFVDHKNSNPGDNRLVNLRYVTPKENVNTPHARAAMSKANDKVKRPVVALDDAGNEICIFDSINQAAKMLNLSPGNIAHVCNGKIKQTGGFKFAWYKK